jgi:microcystin degradation protein MlrC
MHISIAALMQEVNTFTPLTGRLEDWSMASGTGAFEHGTWAGRNSARGAFEELHPCKDIRLHAGLFAIALPGGALPAADGAKLIDRVFDSLFEAGEPDGVLLALHGSMIYEGEDDAEGLLVERIRKRVGEAVPVVAALDMHSKLTPRFLKNIDGVTVYKTAPHTDEMETGALAAHMLLNALKTGTRPCTKAAFVPMVLAGEKSETNADPMLTLLAEARAWERRDGVTCAAFVLGFPWADTAHAGVHAVASGTDQELCQEAAADLAKQFWNARGLFHFTTEAHPPEEAVRIALEHNGSPVILSDSGDNPTAGAAQNMSWFARYLEDGCIGPSLISAIADPNAVEMAVRAGKGARLRVPLGTTKHQEETPFPFDCVITDLCVRENVRVAVLKGSSVTCLVTDQRTDTLDLSLMRACKLNAKDYKIVVVKCGYQGPEFQQAASRSLLCITPGDTNEILEALCFKRIPRPMWPFDASMPSGYDELMRLYPELTPHG